MDNFYENNKNIKKFEVRNLEFPLSSENLFKIIYVESGELQISTADDSFELFGGDTRLFFAGEIHSAFTYDTCVCKIITFPPSFAPDFAEEVENQSQGSGIFKLDSDIDYFESIDESADVYMNKSNLYAILSSFFDKVRLRKSQSGDREFITEVSGYIKENCKDEVTLENLAEHLGYGYNYTSALFKKNFKCGFSFFVNQHRIAMAENLLLQTHLSVTDIAFECGFNSLRSFSRNFQLHKEMSPREFRKNRRFFQGER
ncbi:MAG: AraC family transcriptional regulator [Bacillota bacterium]